MRKPLAARYKRSASDAQGLCRRRGGPLASIIRFGSVGDGGVFAGLRGVLRLDACSRTLCTRDRLHTTMMSHGHHLVALLRVRHFQAGDVEGVDGDVQLGRPTAWPARLRVSARRPEQAKVLRFKASLDSFSPRGKMDLCPMHSLKWNFGLPSRTSSNHLMNDGPFVASQHHIDDLLPRTSNR